MQHNHASRVAVLLDDSYRHLFSLCALSQAGQQFEAFARLP
jgi:hypothetical protein